MDIEFVRSRFIKHFDGTTGSIYASPGRINLIGEHTDYNNGFVFPGAVDKGIMAEIKPNGTDKVCAYSIDEKDYVEFGLKEEDAPRASWAKYIFGVCREMIKRGVDVKGFNTAFAGDVPLGAGMSSSAALESTFAYALNDLFGDNKVDKFELAKVGQATEHNYVGVNCGIMDQFASVFGKSGSLIRLDCRSLEYQYFPFKPQGYKLVLLNTCVKHELVGSPYNERRLSCERVAEVIKAKHPEVESLRDASFFLERLATLDRRARGVNLGPHRRLDVAEKAFLGPGTHNRTYGRTPAVQIDAGLVGIDRHDDVVHRIWEVSGSLHHLFELAVGADEEVVDLAHQIVKSHSLERLSVELALLFGLLDLLSLLSLFGLFGLLCLSAHLVAGAVDNSPHGTLRLLQRTEHIGVRYRLNDVHSAADDLRVGAVLNGEYDILEIFLVAADVDQLYVGLAQRLVEFLDHFFLLHFYLLSPLVGDCFVVALVGTFLLLPLWGL